MSLAPKVALSTVSILAITGLFSYYYLEHDALVAATPEQGKSAGVAQAFFTPASASGEQNEAHPLIPTAALKEGATAENVTFDQIKPEFITESCIVCHVNNDIDLTPPALKTEDGKPGPAYYLGGETGTVFIRTTKAFEQPTPAIVDADLEDEFLLGEAIFEGIYVTDPDVPFGGLGPAYIKSSCVACHPGYGRGRRTDNFNEEYGNGYIAFIHNPDGTPVKGYTAMLQTKAIPPFKPYVEGIDITWHEYKDKYGNKYPDGTPYNQGKKTEGSLIYPTADVINPLLPLPDDYRVSIESTIGIYGTGLLDAIPDSAILAEYERQQSTSGPVKGIHGPWIKEAHLGGQERLGRFTWHCTRATLQNGPGSNGLWNTQGINREGHRQLYVTKEWIDKQRELGFDVSQLEAEQQPVEMTKSDFDNFMIWHRGLAVPAARNLDKPEVQNGQRIFNDIGCASCHKPEWKTGEYPEMPAYANQIIRPYTDLLMHDMGEENRGMVRTYRTPPLWGRGLMKKAADHTDMFHDLRARDFEEAILWHFGESEFARECFRNLSAEDRADLIEFLKSL